MVMMVLMITMTAIMMTFIMKNIGVVDDGCDSGDDVAVENTNISRRNKSNTYKRHINCNGTHTYAGHK